MLVYLFDAVFPLRISGGLRRVRVYRKLGPPSHQLSEDFYLVFILYEAIGYRMRLEMGFWMAVGQRPAG
jgi:hypothetical protein